jgi:hypothetical protein
MKIRIQYNASCTITLHFNIYLYFYLKNHTNPLWPKLGGGEFGFQEVRAPRKDGETTLG